MPGAIEVAWGGEELGATAIMLVHEATCFLPAALQPCVICVYMQCHGPSGGGEGHSIRPSKHAQHFARQGRPTPSKAELNAPRHSFTPSGGADPPISAATKAHASVPLDISAILP